MGFFELTAKTNNYDKQRILRFVVFLVLIECVWFARTEFRV